MTHRLPPRSPCPWTAVAVLWLGLCTAAGAVTGNSGTDEITAERIVERAADGLAADCLDYCFVGICVWLRCSWFGCSIKTTPRIEHHQPDLVVSAHTAPGDLPWREARALFEAPARKAVAALNTVPPTGGGGGQYQHDARDAGAGTGRPHQNLFFKDTSVIGSPAAPVMRRAGQRYFCPSEATMLEPFFLSELDSLSWRAGALSGPEAIYPASYVPGLREVGPHAFNSWGPVHPRSGFIHTNEEPKGAAVLAQRAVDIVTRGSQPHVYRRLVSHRRGQSIAPSDEKKDHWQMLTPRAERQCGPFGVDADYGSDRGSKKGNYSWLYWPEYRCCIPRSGALLLSWFDTSRVCPGSG